MYTPGLTNTPATKLLLLYTVISSILLTILDLKHLTGLHIAPHLWGYGQYWRTLVWQVVGFGNSTEALFACVLVYQARVVERAWGSRKIVSFLFSTLPYTTLLPPLLLALLLRPLTLNTLNYLPSGPTASIFALLAQYHALIPHTFRFRVSTTSSSHPPAPTSSASAGADPAPQPEKPSLSVLLSNKTTTYLLALQLSLSQFPYTILPAAIGWCVGLAWRGEFLPFVSAAWRVPAWVVGEAERGTEVGFGASASGRGRGTGDEGYEGLRRRLEGEVVAASSSGTGAGSSDGRQRRGF